MTDPSQKPPASFRCFDSASAISLTDYPVEGVDATPVARAARRGYETIRPLSETGGGVGDAWGWLKAHWWHISAIWRRIGKDRFSAKDR